MVNSIIKRMFLNKRTKQLSVTIPKKEFKAMNPSLKFSDELFVELKIVKKKKKKRRKK